MNPNKTTITSVTSVTGAVAVTTGTNNAATLKKLAKKLAKKLIPKDFYMEDSMGIRSTDLTHKDILILDSDLFTSLEALERAVFKRLTKLGLDFDHDIRVLLDSTGSIYLAIEK